MFRATNEYTTQITPELARYVQSMTPVSKERKLREPHIYTLTEIVLKNDHREFDWRIARLPDLSEIRVDGQHSSEAWCRLFRNDGGHVGFAKMAYYDVKTWEEVAALYETFGADFEKRSFKDRIGATIAHDPVLHNYTIDHCSTCARGIIYATWGRTASKYSMQTQITEFTNNKMFVPWAEDIFRATSSARSQYLRRSAVASAMFSTYQEDPIRAKTFWLEVAMGTNVDQKSGPSMLFFFLSTHKVVNRCTGARQPSVTNEELHARSLTGWRAWRDGHQTTLRLPRRKSAVKVKRVPPIVQLVPPVST